jgi:hypothetical protein
VNVPAPPSRLPRSRQRRAFFAALAVLAAGLAAMLIGGLVGKTPAPPPPAARAKPAPAAPARDLRAGLPSWARDPDAPPGAVRGLVKTPEGHPLEGALVALIPQIESQQADLRLKPAATARTGRDGRFEIARVRPGEYGATATAEGFAGAFQGGLAVLPGRGLDDVELVLERGGVLVTGRIGDSGGGPIAGAELRVLPGLTGASQTRVFQVVANGEGTFRITLPRARYTMVADADGYAPASRMVDTNATQKADFLLNPAARLAGKVVGRDGAAIAEATVLVAGEQLWWAFPRESRSDGQGRFELRDLDSGTYRVSAHKGPLVGRLPGAVHVAVAARTTEVTITLDAGMTVRGRVTADTAEGAPIAGAKVKLSDQMFGVGGRVRAESDGEGRFRIEGVTPGRLTVSAEAPGRAPAAREVVATAGQEVPEVALALAGEAQVVGKVIGADGAPAVGATVTARITDRLTSAGGAGAWAADRTDARGAFRLAALAGGTLMIEAEVPDTGRASHGPEALAPGETKTVNLTLQPGASVSGTVTWDDGSPAAGATVSAIQPQSMGMIQARSGPDGSYRAGPLAAGQTMVTASRKEGIAGMLDMQVDLKAKEPGKGMQMFTLGANERKRGVDLVIPRGGLEVTGVVLGPDGKPLAGATVAADPEGNMMRGMTAGMGAMIAGGQGRAQSGEDGRFKIEDLTRGPYVVTAQYPGLPEARVNDVANGAREVRVQFRAAAVLSGTAVDGTGKPIADYGIAAVEAPGGPGEDPTRIGDRMARSMAAMLGGGAGAGRQTVNDARGAFEIGGLAAGKYDLLVTTADGRVGKLPGTVVAAGERKTGLRVTVQAGATVRGKVVTFPDGKPATGATVVVLDDQQPMFGSAGDDGSFKLEGLMPGRNYEVTVGGPMTPFISDRFELIIPAGQTAVDAGTLKVVRGQTRFDLVDRSAGVRVEVKGGRATIARVAPRSAAEAAGLRAGQRLHTLDGHDVTGLGRAGIAHHLTAAPGPKVQLGVSTPPATEVQVVTLDRGKPTAAE